MRLSKVFALGLSGFVGLAALSAVGCGGDGGGTGGSGGSGGSGATGGTGTAGSSPSECSPSCDANKGIDSDCVAINDNSGEATYGLRMAQLTINKPEKLTSASNPVIGTLIESGVTMNLEDCNLTGEGTFSWLLQFDTASGKLKTGGALPVSDPTAGYCFVNQMLGDKMVSPISLDAKPDADGKFSVTTGQNVIVPIFLGSADTYVLLPLSDAKIVNATVSSDQNCIGKYNADKLTAANSCEPDGDVTRFENAAELDAYITLEDADSVIISSLKQSLCILLTGDAGDGGMPKKCARDGNGAIVAKGDWCSETNAAGGCEDAMKLGAEFAASAVKVSGDCP